MASSLPGQVYKAFISVNLTNARVEIDLESVSPSDDPAGGEQNPFLTPQSSPPGISLHADHRADFEIVDSDQPAASVQTLHPIALDISVDPQIQNHLSVDTLQPLHTFQTGSQSTFSASSTDLKYHELSFTSPGEISTPERLFAVRSYDAYIQCGFSSEGLLGDTRRQEYFDPQPDEASNFEHSLVQQTLIDSTIVDARTQRVCNLEARHLDQIQIQPVRVSCNADALESVCTPGGHALFSVSHARKTPFFANSSRQDLYRSNTVHKYQGLAFHLDRDGLDDHQRMEGAVSEETATTFLNDVLADLRADDAMDRVVSIPASGTQANNQAKLFTVDTPFPLASSIYLEPMDTLPLCHEPDVVGTENTTIEYLADGTPFQVNEFTRSVPMVVTSPENIYQPVFASLGFSHQGVPSCGEGRLSMPTDTCPDDFDGSMTVVDDSIISLFAALSLSPKNTGLILREPEPISHSAISEVNDHLAANEATVSVQEVPRDAEKGGFLVEKQNAMTQIVSNEDQVAAQRALTKVISRERVKAAGKRKVQLVVGDDNPRLFDALSVLVNAKKVKVNVEKRGGEINKTSPSTPAGQTISRSTANNIKSSVSSLSVQYLTDAQSSHIIDDKHVQPFVTEGTTYDAAAVDEVSSNQIVDDEGVLQLEGHQANPSDSHIVGPKVLNGFIRTAEAKHDIQADEDLQVTSGDNSNVVKFSPSLVMPGKKGYDIDIVIQRCAKDDPGNISPEAETNPYCLDVIVRRFKPYMRSSGARRRRRWERQESTSLTPSCIDPALTTKEAPAPISEGLVSGKFVELEALEKSVPGSLALEEGGFFLPFNLPFDFSFDFSGLKSMSPLVPHLPATILYLMILVTLANPSFWI